jgi:hypothetical protein
MRRFTPEEDAFIRLHYPTKRLAWIAEKLGRPIHGGSISTRARFLKLKAKRGAYEMLRNRPVPAPPPQEHPAIRMDGFIRPLTIAELMAGSAHVRRVHKVQA